MKKHLETAKAFNLKELITYSDGSTVSKILSKNSNGNTTLFAFDKEQELSEHTAPFDATAIIIDGKCEITIKDEKYELKEGEMIIMPANVPHALTATEPFKMLLIMIKE
ncbi:MAG: cupin domain-containing protein [Salegentibacter sp.]|uniref:cupin domain-containing protein n=1 Tax=Salegentibacter sp. TaxID=1903072 RepID=UPI0028708720|nr:cupin domain-containing protein [Salegentibacter sp.]MDR9458054.1 cupin domain-containing protein [Salegentibacter sp.]